MAKKTTKKTTKGPTKKPTAGAGSVAGHAQLDECWERISTIVRDGGLDLAKEAKEQVCRKEVAEAFVRNQGDWGRKVTGETNGQKVLRAATAIGEIALAIAKLRKRDTVSGKDVHKAIATASEYCKLKALGAAKGQKPGKKKGDWCPAA